MPTPSRSLRADRERWRRHERAARDLQKKGSAMHDTGPSASRIALPSRVEADRAVHEARRLFGRALACWASDALHLRCARLNAPTWTADANDHETWSLAA
jgi:hypothetical protein